MFGGLFSVEASTGGIQGFFFGGTEIFGGCSLDVGSASLMLKVSASNAILMVISKQSIDFARFPKSLSPSSRNLQNCTCCSLLGKQAICYPAIQSLPSQSGIWLQSRDSFGPHTSHAMSSSSSSSLSSLLLPHYPGHSAVNAILLLVESPKQSVINKDESGTLFDVTTHVS